MILRVVEGAAALAFEAAFLLTSLIPLAHSQRWRRLCSSVWFRLTFLGTREMCGGQTCPRLRSATRGRDVSKYRLGFKKVKTPTGDLFFLGSNHGVLFPASLNPPSLLVPQGLCTCCFLLLEAVFPRFPCDFLPLLLRSLFAHHLLTTLYFPFPSHPSS